MELQDAEEKLRNKDTEIVKLNDKLKKTVTNSIAPVTIIPHTKQGWLLMKGNLLPTWTRRYFLLSNTDKSGNMYHCKEENGKIMGQINLRGAYVKKEDTAKLNTFVFMVMSEIDKRTYYLTADSEEEMDSWISAIQERIYHLLH